MPGSGEDQFSGKSAMVIEWALEEAMRPFLLCAALTALLSLGPSRVLAADYPMPRDGEWTAQDVRFESGERMAALRLHYTTIGDPSGQPVLILHGTSGSGASLLTPGFAGELFGPGQPLDARKFFIILPDAIGTSPSMKPGWRTPHSQASIPPMELPITSLRCLTPRCCVSSRCCTSTMSP